MTQTEISPGADPDAPRRRPAALRLVFASLVTICGLMIVAVFLSEPHVASRIQAAVGAESDQADNADDIMASSGEKPTVTIMPQNRVPVRRLGVSE